MYAIQDVLVMILIIINFPTTVVATIYHLHEDGIANKIVVERTSDVNLININRSLHYITFYVPVGFIKRHEGYYKRMANRTLIVAADNYAPYVVMKINRNKNNEMEVKGYIGELWLILERVLQFRSVIKRAGFVEGRALLKSGEADVLLQPTVITGNNIGEYDFTRPVASSWYELYVRAPEMQASPGSYFTVWHPNLWMATMATFVLLTFTIRILCKYGAFEEANSTSDVNLCKVKVQPAHVSPGICFLSVLGSLGSEGFQLRPSSASGRVLMVTTLLFSLLLYNSYSAVLVASLAVTNPTLPFSSLEDVAKKGTHALCVRNFSYAYMKLKENESNVDVAPKWRAVVHREPCGHVVDNKDLEAVLCNWRVAVLETPSNMAVVSGESSSFCQMKHIRGQNFIVPVSLELRARFPYTDLINYYIHRLQTSGILHYLRNKWTTQPPMVSEDESVPNTTTVTLRHVQLILSLYAASIVYSILLLVAEIIWFRRSDPSLYQPPTHRHKSLRQVAFSRKIY